LLGLEKENKVKKVAGDSTALFHSFALLQATVKVGVLNWGKGHCPFL
jgi:hypothetical protein